MALVLEPARDLAEQTHEAMRAFARRLSSPALRTALAVGGGSGKDTLRALEAGVDIVTGTPGARPQAPAALARVAQCAVGKGVAPRPAMTKRGRRRPGCISRPCQADQQACSVHRVLQAGGD